MAQQKLTDFSFLEDSSEVVAPKLLGCILERKIGDKILRTQIVETEAYDQSDAASHSYNGRTPRVDVMFGPSGHMYVYFTYGMHYCCNIVTSGAGYGAGVLIRAVEPLLGEEIMRQNRLNKTGIELTNGPAKLCQALKIDKAFNGHSLGEYPIKLIVQPSIPSSQITQTTRIGISKAQEKPWRFYIKDNPYVSKI